MLTLHAFKKLSAGQQLLFARLFGQFHMPFSEGIDIVLLPVTATEYVT
jgi:hypothetical protein